ncbi:unnamed protein product [Calypogeia fissa]
MRQLHSLKAVSLAVGESVKSVLVGIGQIVSLEVFRFDCDGHEETPNLFAGISCVAHELILTGAKTRRLPKGFGSISSLRALSLVEFPLLETLPDDLGTLSSLERLTIEDWNMLESLPESLGQVSSLKETRIESCKRLKTLPESLGKSSLAQPALPQGDQSNELRRRAEELSQRKTQQEMGLIVEGCSLLNDSVLESLGWMLVCYDEGNVYRRKSCIVDSAPR